MLGRYTTGPGFSTTRRCSLYVLASGLANHALCAPQRLRQRVLPERYGQIAARLLQDAPRRVRRAPQPARQWHRWRRLAHDVVRRDLRPRRGLIRHTELHVDLWHDVRPQELVLWDERGVDVRGQRRRRRNRREAALADEVKLSAELFFVKEA